MHDVEKEFERQETHDRATLDLHKRRVSFCEIANHKDLDHREHNTQHYNDSDDEAGHHTQDGTTLTISVTSEKSKDAGNKNEHTSPQANSTVRQVGFKTDGREFEQKTRRANHHVHNPEYHMDGSVGQTFSSIDARLRPFCNDIHNFRATPHADTSRKGMRWRENAGGRICFKLPRMRHCRKVPFLKSSWYTI